MTSFEETVFLGELVRLETPSMRESGVEYNEDYQDLCGDYCRIRNLAKDSLRGDKKAREELNALLEKYNLENAMG